jgi:hypothetical protein
LSLTKWFLTIFVTLIFGTYSITFAGIKKSKTKVFKKACFRSLRECSRAKSSLGILTQKVNDITIGTTRDCRPGKSTTGIKGFCFTPNMTIRYLLSPDKGVNIKVTVRECKYIKLISMQANNFLRGIRCHIYCRHKSTGEDIFFSEAEPRGTDAILTGECNLSPLSN